MTANLGLLSDPYPPFGDKPYALCIGVAAPERRKRLTVACRLLLAIPHIVAAHAHDRLVVRDLPRLVRDPVHG